MTEYELRFTKFPNELKNFQKLFINTKLSSKFLRTKNLVWIKSDEDLNLSIDVIGLGFNLSVFWSKESLMELKKVL